MKRLLIAFLLIAVGIFWALEPPYTRARTTSMSSLKQMLEVRDRIHQHYVDPVDSTRLIDGAIDGMVAVLPEGDNVYLSSTDMSEVADWEGNLSPPAMDNRQQVKLLSEAFRRVNRQYVAPVAADTLSRGAIWGMLATLDPHSSYVGPQDLEQMVERFRGDFEGIGIYFEVRQGRLLVIAPILGSPSDGKLRAGDHITMIEGVPTEGITTEQVMKKLRGPKGSRVRISVHREGEKDWLEVTIKRDRIAVSSVPYAFMLQPATGYIRITRFTEKTGAELGRALESLQNQGLERLLLDLRSNGGGILSQAVEVADRFVEQGELIVYTEGRNAAVRQEYRSQTALRGDPLSLIVMLDHGSASASEIVAGAIQDLDMGLIVGQTSFGKGLVQEQFPLAAGGGLLLLTVARYYTPLGRLIQRPYTEDLQAYVHEGIDDLDPNAVDSLRAAKKVFYTSMGRRVYGGGGITPDEILEIEENSAFMGQVLSSGALFDFSGRWVGSHSDWATEFADFMENYTVPETALKEFLDVLSARDIQVDEEIYTAHLDVLQRELKAGFAQVLWGDERRYQIYIKGDRQILRALELFAAADELVAKRRMQNRDRN